MLVFWSKNIAEMGGTYAVPMRPKTSYYFFGLTILTNIVMLKTLQLMLVYACVATLWPNL